MSDCSWWQIFHHPIVHEMFYDPGAMLYFFDFRNPRPNFPWHVEHGAHLLGDQSSQPGHLPSFSFVAPFDVVVVQVRDDEIAEDLHLECFQKKIEKAFILQRVVCIV
jgi:hypothetical protein